MTPALSVIEELIILISKRENTSMNNVANTDIRPEAARTFFADWVIKLSEAAQFLWSGDAVSFNRKLSEAVDLYFVFVNENTRRFGLGVYDVPNLLLKEHIEDHREIEPGSQDNLNMNVIGIFRHSVKRAMTDKIPGLRRFDDIQDPIYFAAIYNYARPVDVVREGELHPISFITDRILSASRKRLSKAGEQALDAVIRFYKTHGTGFSSEVRSLIGYKAVLSADTPIIEHWPIKG